MGIPAATAAAAFAIAIEIGGGILILLGALGLVLATTGAGRLSVDGLLTRRSSKQREVVTA